MMPTLYFFMGRRTRNDRKVCTLSDVNLCVCWLRSSCGFPSARSSKVPQHVRKGQGGGACLEWSAGIPHFPKDSAAPGVWSTCMNARLLLLTLTGMAVLLHGEKVSAAEPVALREQRNLNTSYFPFTPVKSKEEWAV